jgi:FtsP/CotA-like multicopper oxidase with cupredoxin domain
MNMNRRRFLIGSGAVALATLIPVPRVLATGQYAAPGAKELTAQVTGFDLGDGKAFKAWSYNDTIPGPVLRARLGDTIRLNFINKLPEPSTIHWHGLPVPNAMDGVPGVTQKSGFSG